MDWIAKTPEDIAVLFVKAWNDRRPDKIAELFLEEAEFVNVVGLWWHTREEILKAHQYGLDVIFKDSTLKLIKAQVKIISENIAIIHAKMKLSGQSHPKVKHKSLQDRRNIFSFVAQKTPGGWFCLSAHNTDIVPGAETNLIDEEGIKSVSYRS